MKIDHLEEKNRDIEKLDYLYELETEQEVSYSHENSNDVNARKIYYISDIHIDYKNKKGFARCSYKEYIDHVVCKMNSGEPFGDSPLIIAGDISCYLQDIDYFFSQLRKRREGKIIFVLGNHDIWAYDKIQNRKLSSIIEDIREICKRYDIILLHNEIVFFYDERTKNGELLYYFKEKIISEQELYLIDKKDLIEYSKRAKLIIFGGLGFSGLCKRYDRMGRKYNAEIGLYDGIVSSIEEDRNESAKTVKAYQKIVKTLEKKKVIIVSHCPFEEWSDLAYNPYYIYLNGHTHHNFFERTEKCTIFADNQIGPKSDCYDLKFFYVDGSYAIFENYKNGIYNITYDQYIDFNIGKNIRMKMKRDEKHIKMLKHGDFYMFVYYNTNKSLILLEGGNPRHLNQDIDYYYNNLERYGRCLNNIMEKYMSVLYSVSDFIKSIGGTGKIHGCIVDINFYNHIFVNPIDGQVIPYYAIDTTQKFVYKNLEALLEDKCPRLLENLKKKGKIVPNFYNCILVDNDVMQVSDKRMYSMSRVIKNIQYLLWQNVVRSWNEIILRNDKNKVIDEISKIQIEEK